MLSAKQIAPGQAGEIEVVIRTEGLTALHKSVTVRSNDPQNPQAILTMTAVVEPDFQLSETTIYFGSVPRGKEVVKEITITIPPDRPSRLLSVESTNPNITAKLEPVNGSNGKKYKITAVQKADAKDGYHFGMLMVKTTSTTNPQLNIPIRGMVVPPQAEPPKE